METRNAATPTSRFRPRITNACDACKARKVKCDGRQPCAFCSRRQTAHTCHYSPQKKRNTPARKDRNEQDSVGSSPAAVERERWRLRTERETATKATIPAAQTPVSMSVSTGDNEGEGVMGNHGDDDVGELAQNGTAETAEDETDVPREARLLRDAQGKLIFIGDCAPLSFFQSVRQLVTTRVGQNAFAPETSRYSVLENASVLPGDVRPTYDTLLSARYLDMPRTVSNYLSMTNGLVDLFDGNELLQDLGMWVRLDPKERQDATSAVNYLVLAIGHQTQDARLAQAFFEHARDLALAKLSGTLDVETVQCFSLITVYMLCSCQLNGAFLFFGVAVRAAYSIGVHRTEVNARFGSGSSAATTAAAATTTNVYHRHKQRDRLWKSLRVVDLFLSTSMGRPPATSDVDCTVSYRDEKEPSHDMTAEGIARGSDGAELDTLNASVQILLVMEGIVLEIYSRRKISLQLTEGISRQLRDWSERWMHRLKAAIDTHPHINHNGINHNGHPQHQAQTANTTTSSSSSQMAASTRAIGACQVLSTYYYAVMLVSRPFLMYELCRRLSEPVVSAITATQKMDLPSGRSKLADACVDAACLMVDMVQGLIRRGLLNGKYPLLVSWLFASSLVLGLGFLAGFGRILEKSARACIQALDHFANNDAHARQYSLIAQSLLDTALEHLNRLEMREEVKRREASSQLFGLATNAPTRIRRPNGTMGGLRHDARARGDDLINSSASGAILNNNNDGNSIGTAAAAPHQQRHNPIHAQSFSSSLHPNPHLTRETPRADLPSPMMAVDGPDMGFLGLAEGILQMPSNELANNGWSFLGLGLGGEGDGGSSALNLFPMLESGGGIDLAHYL